MKKPQINEVDITYINTEVDNFLKRIDPIVSAEYDKAGALSKVEKIKVETGVDKSMNLTKSLLKSKFHLLGALFGNKDDAHAQRHAKISEFNDRIKKVIVILDLG